MHRPCYIVLAPGNVKRLEPTILKVTGEDIADDRPWALIDGTKGYVAIIGEEPESQEVIDEALAKALSKKAKKPLYLVTTNDDTDLSSSIEVFAYGQWKGELNATIDNTLVTLGFRFDWMDGGKKVALRLKAPRVKAKAGEAMIRWHSVSQWQQMMRREGDWHELLDGAGSETIDQIIGICTDDDAKVRFLGVTMLSIVSYYALEFEERLAPAFAVLDKLANDRSKKVSKVAIEARNAFVECGESEAVHAEFHWLLNYHKTYVEKALALLDEDRPLVHRYIYRWFDHGIGNREVLPEAAVAKLKQLAQTSSEAQALLDKLAR